MADITNIKVLGTAYNVADQTARNRLDELVPSSSTVGSTTRGIYLNNGELTACGSDFVAANSAITGATNCKITYDSKGLVTAGAALAASDIPSLPASKITSGTFADARIASAATWNAKSVVSGTNDGTNWTDITINGTTKLIKDPTKVLKAGDTMTGTLNTPKVCAPEVQVSTSTSSYTTGCKLVYANDAVKFVFN